MLWDTRISRENKSMSKIIVAYVPVIHDGYRQFFLRHKDVDTLFLLGNDINHSFRQLEKDVRALPPEDIKKAIESLKLFKEVKILDLAGFKALKDFDGEIIMPDEDIMHELAELHWAGKPKMTFDTVFLRWDKHKSFEGKTVNPDHKISKEKFDRDIIVSLRKEADKSSDWYRQIGSVIIKDGQVVLMAHNNHLPSPHTPYVNGDPRGDFKKGVNLELSTAIHSEAAIVAEAARKGISLEGAEIYATTFPCPPCAKLLAYSGIKRLYYADGYGQLDGESVLKSKGVEIIFVES